MEKIVIRFIFVLYIGYLIGVNNIGGSFASVIEIAGILSGVYLIFTFIKEKIKKKEK